VPFITILTPGKAPLSLTDVTWPVTVYTCGVSVLAVILLPPVEAELIRIVPKSMVSIVITDSICFMDILHEYIFFIVLM
jgi:hypothetical protein